MKNVNKLVVAVIAAIILVPVFAFGATIKAGEEVSIKKGDNVRDNLYVAGGNVSVNGIVFGDLLTAGGNILISENVSEDITAAGGAVTILGDSGGDVRVAGGNILVAGDVTGDLVVVGGTAIISSDVSVGKDLVIAGGQISVDGDVAGDVQVAGGVMTINGHIKGGVDAKIDDHLTIGDGAIIDGGLEYSARSADALRVNEGAVVTGEIVFTEFDAVSADGAKNFIFAAIGAFVLFKLIALIIAALVLVWLFKDFSNSIVKGVVRNPLRMLGYGFVVLVVVPAASIVLFITLFGVPLGFIAILSYGLLMLVTCVYTGVVVGAWVSQMIRKSGSAVVTCKNVTLGVILLTVVKLIPIIGWIVGLFVMLVTLGSIAEVVYKKLWSER